MALKLVTAPTTEPITLEEAKDHLRVDGNDEDALISSLITAAREYCEGYQGRAYVTQVWEIVLDAFPQMPMVVPRPPLQSVCSIKYTNNQGVEATFDVENYIVDSDSEPGRIVLASGKSWPAVQLQPVNGVRIRFSAGYGDATKVPASIKEAILLLVGHWHEHREAVLTGATSREIEFAVKALLGMERVVPV